MMRFTDGAPDYAGLSDPVLISRYREGDENACTVLLARYANLINRSVSRIGITGSDSDDLRQEAYMGLMGAIRTYDPAKNDSFSAYAALCIGNSMKNLFAAASTQKAAVYRQTISLDDTENGVFRAGDAGNPESIFLDKEACRELQRLIGEHLSALEREALFSYLSGHHYSDIAKKLHSTPKSVDNALQRARKKLKAVLNDL